MAAGTHGVKKVVSKLQRLLAAFLLLGCLGLGPADDAAAAESRTALVIGNAAYSFAPLANPVNDARDVADALRNAGFEVTLATDASKQNMSRAIRAFGDALKAKGGVGLFYFAGHGVQVSGENYIVPIGDGIASERDLKDRAVTAAEVVDAMAAARNALNIVILDACRNNPLTSATRGLSRVDSNASLFVSFSTSPGTVALDGAGRNSPYTKHLTRAISVPNISLEETFKRTLKGVYQETSGQQTPWLSSSFFGDFVFRPGGAAAPSFTPSPPPATPQTAARDPATRPPDTARTLAGVYRVGGTNPNGSRYAGMLALNQTGDQFRLTWWISRQVFTGTGQFAGKMLVVNWGDKTPVIYSFAPGNRLDGEWADGSATEQLELFSAAAAGGVPPPQGRYRVAGRNPNGSRYSGTVSIVYEAGRYRFDWKVGSSAYRGSGTLDSNVLTVNWGSSTPVVYALAADGTLTGLWDGGKGEEKLTPDR